MAKVYLESTDTAFTVNNSNTIVYGADGNQEVTVVFGVTGLSADQNIEKVIFSKMSSEYTYKQAGNQIQIYFNGSLVTNIPAQGDSDGTELIFANGSANAVLTNGVMTLGKALSDATTGSFDSNLVIPVPTPTPAPTPTPDPTPPAPSDTIAPTLTSSTPADNATAVAVGANIVLTMSENVTAVAGKNITIKKTSDNSTITTIDAADAQITGSGTSTITINPTADLGSNTEYYVLIDSGAFKDASNNNYAGISSTTALSFTTSDTTAPTLTSSTPADNATAVAVGANIVLTMSENVTAVAGKNITIKKTSDNSTITTIDAADAQITGSGTSTITINPTADLGSSTEYYVLIDSGAFKDAANNDYTGISSTTALSFTTVADPVVYLSNIAAGTGGFAINGEVAGDESGYSVSSAGDVNGDGLADLIVGAKGNGATASGAGRSYVVFGKSDGGVVSLATIAAGTGGFAINGEAADDWSGASVSSAGDVNGDGLADLIVGAPANDTGVSNAGRSYVIFGKSNNTEVNLATIAAGTGGFAINGEATNDYSGRSVSSAGDINGDGLADLIVGAIYNDATAIDAGRSYVVFGKSDGSAVSLATIAGGTGGFAINGEEATDQSGYSVSSAGDVNGDGLADLIVGAYANSSYAGRSYVVFGKSGTTAVSLSALGTGGFAINGEATLDLNGYSVSSAGDVNGDGLADLIVGANGNDTGAPNSGRSYIVFGKSDGGVVSLATIAAGTGGFAINGEAASDTSGSSVSSAGDVNGDGLADLIVGAYKNDTGGTDAGRSYVVFGKSDGSVVSLATIAAGTGGFAINGEAANDRSGYSVSSAGDVNGDGLVDLIVGAYYNDATASNAGRSYVIFGGTQWLTTNVSGAGTVTGTAADEAIIGSSSSDTLTGGGGIDRFYAGDSNDIIVLTSSDITNLSDNTTGSPKSAINGGGDIDTIRLTAGANLDLTTIANQGASGVEENSRIESIEKIDMATDTGANTLTLTVNDVIDMSGMNLFNTGNGWTNGTYTLGASVAKHQLIVDGTAADSLVINAGNGVWANSGSATNGGATYNVYDNTDSNAQILVRDVVVVTNNDAAVDATAPTLISSAPADDATAVAVGANIVLTMSENVTAVTGKKITIKKTSDNSTITEIDAADAQVTGSGTSTITINPTADLGSSTEYYVLIDSGVFKDAANNDYTGISSTTALSFTTAVDPVVYLSTIAAGTGGFAINGQAASDQSGYSVSSAGDVNGDGLADLIVGAYANSSYAGRSYVVFGKSDGGVVSLATIAAGTGGFAINREAAGDYSGYSVSSAGDVNGDGLADLIVGARFNDPGNIDAGRSYVVFGKSDTTVVNLSTIAAGTGGFAINGQAATDQSGYSVSSAGDVNGDGLADLIVGAWKNSTNAGRSYVVFGKSDGSVATLSTIAAGTGGFAINGEAANDTSGASVSSAGDVNGDGLSDLIVGAYGNDTSGSSAGRSYVVFGKNNNTTAINLVDIGLGTGGFAINGEAADDQSGNSVSSAGDVNGDGLADLIVGAYLNDTGGLNAGRSYVVFGKSDGGVVSLATIAAGTGGFAINGEAANDNSGYSVSSAGDINGDGLADLIVGANGNDTGATNAGRSYVVFGKSDTTTVSLSAIAAGTGGFAINGQAATDSSGRSVSSAGDVNGDGLADLIVGASGNDATASNAGRSYVIFGGAQWLATSVTGTGSVTGTAAAEAIIGSSSSDTLTGGGGIDRFYSGDSNDVILLTSSDITNLADNTTGSPKSVINGGGDIDTIRLTAGANLDLTTIANQGASGVEENSRIESIEKIDMSTDTGANTLTLTVNDVIDMSGMNIFNATNGWIDGSYALGASVAKHQLVVDGDATDSLVINAGNGVWATTGNVTKGGVTYNVYDNVASNAQILVLSGVVVTNNDA